MAEQILSAYDGAESYVFVTYSHADADQVIPQIRWLQDQGLNIAWDEGISPGAAWRSEIAEAIRGCALLLFFTTPNSVRSKHCTREVNFALDDHHRPVLAVHLSKTVLPDALALSLSDRQAILQHALEPEDYERKLVSAVATYLAEPVPAIKTSLPLPSRLGGWRTVALLLSSCLVVLGATAGLLIWSDSGSEKQPPAGRPLAGMQLPLSLPNFSYFPYKSLALSKDGTIAYAGVEKGERFLYLKKAGELATQKLQGTIGARAPFFSPDGNWVGFYANGKLRRSPVNGGSPVDIAKHPALMGVSWGDNNQIVFTPGWSSTLLRLSIDGGTPEVITKLTGEQVSHRNPFVLPGSKAILFQTASHNRNEVWVVNLASQKSHYLTRGESPQYYNGKLLFYRESDYKGALWSVDFDPTTLKTLGDPKPVVEEALDSYALNNSGALIYSVPSPSEARLMLFNKAIGEPTVVANEFISGMRFSPDGQSLAVPRKLNGVTNIWIYSLDAQQSKKQLTLDGGRWPIWSPDGKTIAYEKFGTGMMIRSVIGSEPPEVLVEKDVSVWPQQWNDDGILYMVINRNTQGDLYFRANDGRTKTISDDVVASPHASISPDGNWIAMSRYETEKSNVWIESYPESGPRQRVPVNNGSWPRWSKDGTSLYAASLNRVMRVPITKNAGGIGFDKPVEVHELSGPMDVARALYDISPDQSQFVITDIQYKDAPSQALILNWPKVLLDSE